MKYIYLPFYLFIIDIYSYLIDVGISCLFCVTWNYVYKNPSDQIHHCSCFLVKKKWKYFSICYNLTIFFYWFCRLTNFYLIKNPVLTYSSLVQLIAFLSIQLDQHNRRWSLWEQMFILLYGFRLHGIVIFKDVSK